MDQPCYKCGHAVEEGVRFCQNCGAPQIRVVIAQPVVAATGAEAYTEVIPPSGSAPASLPVLALPMRWSQALKPCILASFIATVLMFLGLYPIVATFCAGFLAVAFYRQRLAGMPIATRTGLRLGAFSGLLSFGTISLLMAIASTLPEFRAKFHAAVFSNLEKWAASHPADTQFQATVDQFKTPEGFAAMLIVGGVLLLVFSLAVGGLGGVLGAKLLGRKPQS